jgi:hypothetical protein
MHLAKSGLDAHIHGRKVWVRCHDTNHAAGGGIKAGSDDTKHDIFAGEDTSD